MATSGAIGEQAEPAQAAAPARAAMANPAPWAVTAFATTSFMLGMYQTHMLNNAGIPIVLPAAFFFGGLVQIIAPTAGPGMTGTVITATRCRGVGRPLWPAVASPPAGRPPRPYALAPRRGR
jgi:hypothetical protein